MKTIGLLKDGRSLELRLLRSIPDDRYAEIAGLFRHKRPYLGHFEDFRRRGARGALEGLEWRTYVGMVEERIVGTVCVWEHGGYGILGHVFTLPEFRRLGVAKAMMEFQDRDFASRSGKIMQLNTGFQGNAYDLYRSFGYEDSAGRLGSMVQQRREDEWDRMYRKGPVRATSLRWKHWPSANLLFLLENESYVRCAGMGIYGPNSIESWFCLNPARIGEAGERRGERIEVLVSDRGAVVGWASSLSDPNHAGKSRRRIFDLVFHPRFEKEVPKLLKRFSIPRRTLAYSTPEDPKNGYLEELGFEESLSLPRYFQNGLALQVFEKKRIQ
jgi:GNAT superfamily N-acetyltransferase